MADDGGLSVSWGTVIPFVAIVIAVFGFQARPRSFRVALNHPDTSKGLTVERHFMFKARADRQPRTVAYYVSPEAAEGLTVSAVKRLEERLHNLIDDRPLKPSCDPGDG
eukprot:TRINITY_DN54740_c0_g1_i1.p1 TRINITY_DN54740_c0_g1~~TRINITY_DN54740_c0_g1_i1.p1  ORF type:complete len:109 (+),score=11.51 TRINITY_DN54740_c0_g1_i1:116-442(+)